jgi:uroporphyrinogen decarboxylase
VIQPGTWSPLFCKVCELCGMEKALIDIALNPLLIEAIVEKIGQVYREIFVYALDATKDICDVVFIGDDYASSSDLIISLEHWRKYFKKPYAKLIEIIKSYGKLVNFHCCGAMSSTIPDLIEIGVDIINPIQPKANGMDPARLVKEYGKYVTFYGGIDVQGILPFGTKEDVRKEVAKVCNTFGGKGGYILASSHTLLNDIPIENIVAMYDEAKNVKFV